MHLGFAAGFIFKNSLGALKHVRRRLTTSVCAMSVMKCRMNAVTGRAEWVVEQDELFDYRQETARSSFADMLHDTERNDLYEEALRRVIGRAKSDGKDAYVVDIGTGTGLLSLMAARAGADDVVAIEVFDPMARIAKEIIALNGYTKKINVITKRSTDLDEEEMPRKGNILVAEVFDTELIGEGALATFIEAHRRLLVPGSRVIPAKADVWVQPIQSAELRKWNDGPQLINDDQLETTLRVLSPASVSGCSGSAAVHDLQLDQIPPSEFIPVCEPIKIFQFDFEDPASLLFDQQTAIELLHLEVSAVTRIDAVFMWWTLDMDGSGELLLSTQPQYRNKSKINQWRDHWMQAVYYLPKPVELNVVGDGRWYLHGAHDEYSFWFDVAQGIPTNSVSRRPICDCRLHMVCSRSNMGRLNDVKRRAAQIATLSTAGLENKRIVVIGDDVLLPVMCQQWGSKSVTAISTNPHIQRVIADYAEANSAGEVLQIFETVDSISPDEQVDIIVSSTLFLSSMLPWHDLHLWYSVRRLVDRLMQTSPPTIYPDVGELWCMPVVLEHLWKIRAPVGPVQGFDLTPFDRLMKDSMEATDELVEPQPLWEYPCRSAASPVRLQCFDLSQPVPGQPIVENELLHVGDNSEWNGIIFWMDWKAKETVISSGLPETCSAGEVPKWDRNCRQAVYFRPSLNADSSLETSTISIKTTFQPDSGQIDFEIR